MRGVAAMDLLVYGELGDGVTGTLFVCQRQ